MFLLNLLRYLRGYVWFEARGVFVERFLNLIARDHIAVWSGSKRGDVYTGCVAAKDYRRLRRHAKKAGIRLRVGGKHGVPFQRRKFRGRTGLLVGLVVFAAFLFGMSLFIWRIEVNGNERIDDLAILQALESLEITPGAFRRGIDVRDCERKLLLLVPDLSWAALNIDGSSIYVEVSESILPPDMIDPKLPCNVVAAEAGQIVAMNVFDGQALVGIGDTVLPGDIVVSGITQDRHGQSLYRHARAEVFAETTQVLEARIPLATTEYQETGKTVTRRYLGIFGADVPLFLPWRIPLPYHVDRTVSPLVVGGTQLPLVWYEEVYSLMEEVPVTLTEEEAKAMAAQELGNLQKVRLDGAEIRDKRVSGQLDGDAYVLRAEFDCRMDIAREQVIPFSHTESGASTEIEEP